MRKNYLIKKRFQFNFIYKFLVLILLEAALIASLLFYMASDTITTGYLDSVLIVERTQNFFLVPAVFIMLIVATAIALLGMVIFALLSHRIAGPIYRFEQDLETVTSGDLTKRINLRKTDQLDELKESLNLLIESLDQRIGRVRKILEEMENTASKEAIERLKREIDYFKVTSGSNE